MKTPDGWFAAAKLRCLRLGHKHYELVPCGACVIEIIREAQTEAYEAGVLKVAEAGLQENLTPPNIPVDTGSSYIIDIVREVEAEARAVKVAEARLPLDKKT